MSKSARLNQKGVLTDLRDKELIMISSTSILQDKNSNILAVRGCKIALLVLIIIFSSITTTAASSLVSKLDHSSQFSKQPLNTDVNYLNHLIEKGNKYQGASLDSALIYFERALQISEKCNYPKGLATCNLAIGKYYLSKSEFHDAKTYLTRADSICANNDLEIIRLENSIQLGKACIMLGEFEQARYVTETGRLLANKYEDLKSLGFILKNLGMIHSRQSNFQQALEANFKSLISFEKAGFASGIAGMHNNIGHIYSETGKPQKAIEQFEKARSIFQKTGDSFGEVLCLNNIGNRYIEIQKVDRAIPYLFNANKLLRQTNDKLGLLYNCLSLSDALAKKGRLTEAENFIDEANTLCVKLGKTNLLPYVYSPLIMVKEKEGQIEEAKILQLKTVQLAETHSPPNQVMEIKKSAADFFERHNDFKQALLYTEEAQLIQDSLFTQERTREIDALQTQFESKEKERENNLLKKDNELQLLKIKQQQRNLLIGLGSALLLLGFVAFLLFQQKKIRTTKSELEISLKEKETLLKEVHHRVKNNLQLITSLLNIQADKDAPQTIEDFLTRGQTRVKSMALIHDQLYRSDNVAFINMQEYIEALTKSILDVHGTPAISCKVRCENAHLGIDQAIPAGLIINELVSNCLKHAFHTQDTGNIVVKMVSNEARQVVLEINDDGSGFNHQRPRNSIGLQLVAILSEQLRGTFQFGKSKGTSAVVTFLKM